MFGYVIPCKMELKIKDYEKVKAYYCGLCKEIKENYGNLPRLTLSYDMVFLSIFLDSFQNSKNNYIKSRCILHPFKKRIFLINNDTLKYTSFLNISLAIYNLLDDIQDDNSIKSKLSYFLMKKYINKFPSNLININNEIDKKLNELYILEKQNNSKNLDELSHPFGELTAYLILSYLNNDKYKEELYNIGYNLGKWIYIMDAFDDLKEDMKNNKFNAINSTLNKDNLPYNKFINSISDRINFTLTSYARTCAENLELLPIKKNRDIIFNIFYYGLLEKMNNVFLQKEEI